MLTWHNHVALFTLGWVLQSLHPAQAPHPPAGLAVAAARQVAPRSPVPPPQADFAGTAAPATVAQVAQWALHTRNHLGGPFLIVDKRDARLWVFNAQGRLQVRAPVLLGLARGDDSVPGIGERPIEQIRPFERTTPAGRFVAQAGHNLKGEDILWVDYADAISMHRVRPVNPRERRLQRLASPSPADNRISYGCINVPVAVFNAHVAPAMQRHSRLVVYVLPDVKPLEAVFGPGIQQWATPAALAKGEVGRRTS